MAFDKVVDSAQLDAGMTATADAIRGKTGGTNPIEWDVATGFKSAVEGIQAGGGDGTICGYEARTGSFTLSEDVASDYTVEFEKLSNGHPSDYIIMGWIDFITVHGTIINTYNAGQLSSFFLTYAYWSNGSKDSAGYSVGKSKSGSKQQSTAANTNRTSTSFSVPFTTSQKGIAGCKYNWLLIAMKK